MRRALVAVALAVLAACNNAPAGHEPNGPIRSLEPSDTNEENVAAEVQNVGDLPSPNEGLRFVGRWAEDQRACASKAWTFTQTILTAPDGASCNLDRVNEVPGGYDVQATCTAKGAPTGDVLNIRFAESAKAMLLDSKTFGSKGLIFCGRDV